jgi:molybdopterin-containing oxidoreductase family membrane subunit
MAALRKFLRLEEYLHPVHFQNLGKLLLMMSLLWAYFVFNERLMIWYGNEPAEMAVFWVTQRGAFAPLYWTMIICNFVIPFLLLTNKRLRTVTGCVVASVAVCIGMWLERFLIVVPSLGHLSPATGRDLGHHVDCCRDDLALRALCQVRSHYLDLGAQGRRTPLAANTGVQEGAPALAGHPMKAFYALYPNASAAQRAVNRLRSERIAEHDIVIVSSEPIEEYEFGQRDKATWLYYIASGGGLVGLCVGVWLARMTQTAWPLPTGGMPIVAWWPNLIIMFELTMLGGILATVMTLFITAKIPSREVQLYDPEVADGKILVGVKNPHADTIPALKRALLVDLDTRIKAL